MAASYSAIKKSVIEVVDDFSELDVTANYGTKYDAKTKLEKLGIGSPALAVMPPRFNKVMKKLAGIKWQSVGSVDLVAETTIGGLVLLGCGQSGTIVPQGEVT